MGNTAITYKL